MVALVGITSDRNAISSVKFAKKDQCPGAHASAGLIDWKIAPPSNADLAARGRCQLRQLQTKPLLAAADMQAMSRSPRTWRPGSLQLITSLFVDRVWRLSSGDERAHYLSLLGSALAHTDWRCLAYSVTGEQVLLVVRCGKQSLESWAKRVHPPFAHWLNKRRRRLGPVFSGRPRAIEIPHRSVLDVLAYVHNGPVRVGLGSEAGECACSSHRAYVGGTRPPAWLDNELGLTLAGFSGRPHDFDEAVRARRGMQAPRISDERECDNDSDATERGARARCGDVMKAVADVLGVPGAALRQRQSPGPLSDAKRITIHAARACEIPLARIANAMHLSRQRASRVASMMLAPEHQRVVDEIVRLLAARAHTESGASSADG